MAKHDIEVILSTGMSNLTDIYSAYRVLNPKVIMQCTSAYPSELYDLNLNVIEDFRNKFQNSYIGYSNHYPHTFACKLAYGMGAEWIEFHYTLDKESKGTDHSLSFNRRDVDELLNWCNMADIAKGSACKYVEKCEHEAINKLRSDL